MKWGSWDLRTKDELKIKIEQLEDQIITAKNIINCGLTRHSVDDKYRDFLEDAQKVLEK